MACRADKPATPRSVPSPEKRSRDFFSLWRLDIQMITNDYAVHASTHGDFDDSLHFIDLLRRRAGLQPDQIAYRFLLNGENEEMSITYAELDRRARAIGALLQSMRLQGERALLIYPPGLEYIAAFFGCLYAEVIAVPAYPPRLNRNVARLEAIINDAGAKVALTTESTLSKGAQIFEKTSTLNALRWIATDSTEGDIEETWTAPSISGDSLVFLQYTSGSTGTPKGVMLTHKNLISNSMLIQNAFGHTPSSRGVTWLPPYHDMGLIGGILQPMYVGFPNVMMSPMHFLQSPIRWLKAITRYKATTSGGPNFAYDLCVRKIDREQMEALDLTHWELAFNGAEPIRHETLRSFSEKFGARGFRYQAFYPCYGMAEATLIVSGGIKLAGPVVRAVKSDALTQNQIECSENTGVENKTLVSSGQGLMGQKIVVVNPESCIECKPGQIGEIWISGPSVASGYWRQAEETEKNFRAYLADKNEGPFLRTGDLGALLEGELFITGRRKDLIIIRGRNYYPQDIEKTVEGCHPMLRLGCGAAFSVELENEERLVVVQEVEHRHKAPLDEIFSAIRQSVADLHGLSLFAILLLKAGTLPKTSSGKTQRYACRSGFLQHSLDIAGEWREAVSRKKGETSPVAEEGASMAPVEQGSLSPSAEAIENWLVAQLAARTGVHSQQISIREPFSHYGLSSVDATSLSGELQTWLGKSLSPTLIWDCPTIELLARHLAGSSHPLPVELETDKKERRSSEPIAIIGIGCRLPKAATPEAFWKLLQEGTDAVGQLQEGRAKEISVFSPVSHKKPKEKGITWGGFLEDVDLFDASFFGISPREAVKMDPQQRLLLEVAWEALERAGQATEQLAGSMTGVFVGISNNDYARLLSKSPDSADAYTGTGNAYSIAANRISYILDLRGPSLAVDTACSSSLVALHLACQSLRSRECSMALAGGVNLILSPELTAAFSEAKMMAPDGRCKTFDARADGYVRGEGCGVVVLKPLSAALADGDEIHAVIRGSAVNQDGRTNGLTAPNGKAQQAVIRQALQNAGVDPSEIGYVETHGTGTPLGDPIEVEALTGVLMQGRAKERRSLIGSVKTNIGHLEAAAGIAGLIKTVMALKQGEVPANLHLSHLNPRICLDQTYFEIPTKAMTWPAGYGRRLAGVSSFGFGGTNAHLILEEPPVRSRSETRSEQSVHVLTLSAKSEQALKRLTSDFSSYLDGDSSGNLSSICYSVNAGRSHLTHRIAAVADSIPLLREQLAAFSEGRTAVGLESGQIQTWNRPKIAFLFTGQGAQYPEMGRRLYETEPTFRIALDRCDAILRGHLEIPLLSLFYGTASASLLLNQTAYAQPILFSLEYALAEMLASWGIKPDALLGHSVGEYTAACIAGIFSLEEGLKLVTERGRLMQGAPETGAMIAVFAESATLEPLIAPYSKQISVASINSPENVIISGAAEAIKQITVMLSDLRIPTRSLNVSHAFHSPLMEPICAPFEESARKVTFGPARIPMASNLTGELIGPDKILNAKYWSSHLRRTVQFSNGIQALYNSGCRVFLELGPNPILRNLGKRCVNGAPALWLSTLKKGQDDRREVMESLAALHVYGVEVDWKAMSHGSSKCCAVLPTYPFQRTRHWMESPRVNMNKALFPGEQRPPEFHPLLGRCLSEKVC